MSYEPRSMIAQAVNEVEEVAIALILGLMTVVTFANVVARYVFNDNLLWALETTSFLFAWLVLVGCSHMVKINAHLGVDALVNTFSKPLRRALTLISAFACLIFSLLLLKGAWDYWAPFAELQPTTGRIIPTGIADVRGQGWYEVEDIMMPDALNPFLSNLLNYGERYEKIPRAIPYVILPITMLLLVYRCAQSLYWVWIGERDLIIVSHEAEEALEEASSQAPAAAATTLDKGR
ncbi:MAG: TRAP transporter small permease [Pseudomonadota bacterium]